MNIRDSVWEVNKDALIAESFELALIGYVEGNGRPAVALYDRFKCIDILINRDGMQYDEATEYFDYKIINADVGENTPLFATILKDLKNIYPCS